MSSSSRVGIEHLQGIAGRNDKRIEADDIRVRVRFQGAHDLHFAPQGSDSGRCCSLLGPMYKFDGNFGGMML